MIRRSAARDRKGARSQPVAAGTRIATTWRRTPGGKARSSASLTLCALQEGCDTADDIDMRGGRRRMNDLDELEQEKRESEKEVK